MSCGELAAIWLGLMLVDWVAWLVWLELELLLQLMSPMCSLYKRGESARRPSVVPGFEVIVLRFCLTVLQYQVQSCLGRGGAGFGSEVAQRSRLGIDKNQNKDTICLYSLLRCISMAASPTVKEVVPKTLGIANKEIG